MSSTSLETATTTAELEEQVDDEESNDSVEQIQPELPVAKTPGTARRGRGARGTPRVGRAAGTPVSI